MERKMTKAVSKTQSPVGISEAHLDRILDRCFKSIEAHAGDSSRLFFPSGIELIRIAAKGSLEAPNFDFEVTIAGSGATPQVPKPAAGFRMVLEAFGPVQQACENLFAANSDDCNKFAKAVAGSFGITLSGNADSIVGEIQNTPWNYIGNDLAAAKQAADFASQGRLVVGGLTATEIGDTNGHVVVVVPGSLVNGNHPLAYWGSISLGKAAKDKGVNFAFRHPLCDSVRYGWISI
jgi:hypothetical protein